MSKTYELVVGQTYATLTRVFRAGVQYSEADLGDSVKDTNDGGEAYFAEVGAAPVSRRSMTIGKGKSQASSGDSGGSSGDGAPVKPTSDSVVV